MKRLLFMLLVLIIPFSIVYAAELNITIEDVVISDNSSTVDVTLSSYSNNEIVSNIVFNNKEEYVIYDITIRNNEENKYLIKKITDNNQNENVKITYDFSDDYIEPNETAVIKMTVKYEKQLKNVDSISLDDISINIVLDDGTVVINPGTGDRINFYIGLTIISTIVIVIAIIFNKKISKILPVMILFLILPITALSKEVLTIKFVIKNIEVTGIYDMFNVQIVPDNTDANSTTEIRYGDPVGALGTPSKDGYDFVGWYDENGNQILEDTPVTSDLVITARYTAIEYPITYNLDGGNATNANKYTIEQEITLNNPSKEGYNFQGWYTNESFEGTPITKIELGSTGPKEFFAKWEIIDYSITYNLNGGNQNPSATLEYNIATDTFDLPFPTRENYHFKGWYTNEGLTGNVVNSIPKGTTGNKEYYAKWEAYKNYIGYDVYDVVKDEAVSDGVRSLFVPSDDGIDFSRSSGMSNGSGKYVMDSTKNDEYPVYYYRGMVEDNNVILGDFCWLIVRTTSTGGTKLIYNGLAEDGKCLKTGTDTFISSKIKFNSSYSRPEATGYTYNGAHTQSAGNFSTITTGMILGNDVVFEDGVYKLKDQYVVDESFKDNIDAMTKNHHYTCLSTSDECATVRYIFMGRDPQFYYVTLSGGEKIEDIIEFKAFNAATTTNSTVKTNIDTWYSNNLTSKTYLLEDTVWCNDRSTYTKGGWDKDTSIYEKVMFGATARLSVLIKPSVNCTNLNDRYTVSSENGNGVLTYPIGLLTADETALGGFAWFDESESTYLNNGHIWWTMSPSLLSANFAYIDVVYSMLDNVHAAYVTSSAITSGGVRPAISLDKTTKIISGNGTRENPFIVEE